jgi:5-oxoprolinase (ATP-hydrolysing)
MGGTSTDVSRIEDKSFETKYSFEVEGIEICTPHLDIDTIAAGGGSKLSFKNGMFVVGPESVGSHPGPVCYGIGSIYPLKQTSSHSPMQI